MRKTLNPRKVRPREIIRFRGIYDPDAFGNVPKQYVGNSSNLISHKIREMNQRHGQDRDDSYDDGINSAKRKSSGRVICEGSSLWAEGFLPQIDIPVIDYDPPEVDGKEIPIPPIPPVKNPPFALFAVDDLASDRTVTVTDKSIGSYYNIRFNFGDGTVIASTRGSTEEHQYDEDGWYKITITAYGIYGTTKYSKQIFVEQAGSTFIDISPAILSDGGVYEYYGFSPIYINRTAGKLFIADGDNYLIDQFSINSEGAMSSISYEKSADLDYPLSSLGFENNGLRLLGNNNYFSSFDSFTEFDPLTSSYDIDGMDTLPGPATVPDYEVNLPATVPDTYITTSAKVLSSMIYFSQDNYIGSASLLTAGIGRTVDWNTYVSFDIHTLGNSDLYLYEVHPVSSTEVITLEYDDNLDTNYIARRTMSTPNDITTLSTPEIIITGAQTYLDSAGFNEYGYINAIEFDDEYIYAVVVNWDDYDLKILRYSY